MLARIGRSDMPVYPAPLSEALSIRVPQIVAKLRRWSPAYCVRLRRPARLGCIRDPGSLDLEDLDIGAPSVDLRTALAERSAQIHQRQLWRERTEGQRLNASIDIRQVPRPSRAVRGGAALHLGISGQGTQRKRRSNRGRYPASVRPLSRRRRRAVAGIHHRDLRLHGAYGHRSSLPDLSEDVRKRARNLRAIAAAQQERIDVAREQFESWLPTVGADWALAPVRGLATIFRMAGLILPDRHVQSFDHDRTMAMKSWLVGSPTLH